MIKTWEKECEWFAVTCPTNSQNFLENLTWLFLSTLSCNSFCTLLLDSAADNRGCESLWQGSLRNPERKMKKNSVFDQMSVMIMMNISVTIYLVTPSGQSWVIVVLLNSEKCKSLCNMFTMIFLSHYSKPLSRLNWTAHVTLESNMSLRCDGFAWFNSIIHLCDFLSVIKYSSSFVQQILVLLFE